MIIRPVDLEATGKEATDEVVEIGCYDIDDILSIEPKIGNGRRTFVKPARSIPPGASAVHHITDADVADSPTWADAWDMLTGTEIGSSDEEIVFAAHFASYERQYLDPLFTARWIDTWKCSLRQWPTADEHKLQTLRYWLDLKVDSALAWPPHRALPDAYICALLVVELLKHQTVETLVQWSSEPAVFTKFDFGENTGKPLSEVRSSYFEFILDPKRDFSPDWKWNAQRELKRRADAEIEKANSERRQYVDHCIAAITGAATEKDLVNWYHGSVDAFARHGILVDSDEYVRLIGACRDRKQQLQAGTEPDFGGTK